jgi:hypothetical protein
VVLADPVPDWPAGVPPDVHADAISASAASATAGMNAFFLATPVEDTFRERACPVSLPFLRDAHEDERAIFTR